MRLTGGELTTLARTVLEAAGARADDAAAVAADLVGSNLRGHDSHGVMRLVQYVGFIEDGFIRTDAEPTTVVDRAALAVVDARSGFGQVATKFAFGVAAAKARECGTASVWVRNCNHVGRLGGVTEAAAADGFAAVMTVNLPGPGQVAPFGARERRMGTNPVSFAFPASSDGATPPVVLDMTTSATAEGKLRVARQSGRQVAEGLMIDRDGRPTTDPEDFYRDNAGCILPLGGDLGHKGFGLGVAVDLMSGVLSGAGVARTDLPRGANGVWLSLTDVSALLSPSEYDGWLTGYRRHITSAAPIREGGSVLLPGDVERATLASRSADGVDIPAETWRQIGELADRLGADVSGFDAGADHG